MRVSTRSLKALNGLGRQPRMSRHSLTSAVRSAPGYPAATPSRRSRVQGMGVWIPRILD